MKIAVVSLWVDDVQQAIDFYQNALQLELITTHGELPHFQLENGLLVLLKGKPQPATHAFPESFPLLALEVPDLDSLIDCLKEQGVRFPWGIEERKDSRWAMFHDPSGNLLEIVQHLTSPPEKQ